jgi:hypothetical protein
MMSKERREEKISIAFRYSLIANRNSLIDNQVKLIRINNLI